jgi:HD-like signal output (HDOD) protein
MNDKSSILLIVQEGRAMGITEQIQKHASRQGQDFAAMFEEIEIPPLPAAASQLVAEINKDEPDISELTRIISTDVEISTKVMRTVNSALYGLPNPVASVQQAVSMLGLRSIRSLALTYTAKSAVPRLLGTLFDHEAFWTDSLLRALLARALSNRFMPGEEDEAFTAMLFADVALPMLLGYWEEAYKPVAQEWLTSPKRLSWIEQEVFMWDHAQAGAWILESWNFPSDIVSLVSVHNLPSPEIRRAGLDKTIALPLITAAILPSVLRPSKARSMHLTKTACRHFSMSAEEFGELIVQVHTHFNDIREQFGLPDKNSDRLVSEILDHCGY